MRVTGRLRARRPVDERRKSSNGAQFGQVKVASNRGIPSCGRKNTNAVNANMNRKAQSRRSGVVGRAVLGSASHADPGATGAGSLIAGSRIEGQSFRHRQTSRPRPSAASPAMAE